jgi:hypothetical protein
VEESERRSSACTRAAEVDVDGDSGDDTKGCDVCGCEGGVEDVGGVEEVKGVRLRSSYPSCR